MLKLKNDHFLVFLEVLVVFGHLVKFLGRLRSALC